MKLLCSQRDLDSALNIVDKAINHNNSLPVLNNVLLKAEGKKLYLFSTNLEIAISCSIDAEVRGDGSITVPAKLITSYVSLLSDQRVELSQGADVSLALESNTSHTKIKCISAEEFPLIPKVEKEHEITIGTKELYEALNEVVFAASVNTSRPVLSGVYVSFKENVLKFVSTDSYRLAEREVALIKNPKQEFSCIVPARTMTEVVKILSKSIVEDVKIAISKNQILFSIGEIELVSRLIEGRFPDYEKILPTTVKTKLEVVVEDLSLVLKRVSLFARENNNSVKLVATNDGKLLISSDETKVGEEKAEVSIKIDGENNKILLNSQYLLDVLTYINDDKITFVMNDGTMPALIKPVKRENYSYIIMPLKV